MPEHIVDFHIHSRYAYATSKDMNLTEIYRWSKIKGISIEFYPEEGKYYADGHRKCDVCNIPDPSSKQDTVCSVCGKQLTIGVLSRVQSLSKVAKQRTSQVPQKRVEYIIPLTEIIAEQLGVNSTKSKRVQKQ